MQATAKITKRSTMQEILEVYPSAQRALFGRYHIGGCNSCGYEPEDILEKVANSQNINDLYEVIAFIGLGPEPHVRGRPTAAWPVVRRRDDVDRDRRRDHDGRTSARSAVECVRPPSPDCWGAFPGSRCTNRADYPQ
jgi:hypothetical protein